MMSKRWKLFAFTSAFVTVALGFGGAFLGRCPLFSLAQLSVDSNAASEIADKVSALLSGASHLRQRKGLELSALAERKYITAAVSETGSVLSSILRAAPMTEQAVQNLTAAADDLAANTHVKNIRALLGKEDAFESEAIRVDLGAAVPAVLAAIQKSVPHFAGTDWSQLEAPIAKLQGATASALSELDFPAEGHALPLMNAGVALALVEMTKLGQE